MNLQNLQQKIDILLMTKITQNMMKDMTMTLALNLKHKLSNQILVIIEMHIFL